MTDEQLPQAEHYLELFENAIRKHIDIVGEETALEHARQVGLGVSPDGHIVSCFGHPMLVLLRLIKVLAKSNSVSTLIECMPLIDEMERIQTMLEESPVQS